MTQFSLKPSLIKAIKACGYTSLTPVQNKVIPLLLTDKQLVVQAETGAGKTAAFLIPAIEKTTAENTIQTLIIEPTRELALQTASEAERLSVYAKVSSASLVGGLNIEKQERRLKNGVQMIIGTPGRLNDLYHQGLLDLSHLKLLILDEADQIIGTGQKEECEEVLMHCECQTALFSATVSDDVLSFMAGDYTDIRMNKAEVSTRIHPYYCLAEDKKEALVRILTHLPVTSAIVFVKYKDETLELAKYLGSRHILASAFSSHYEERSRMKILEAFRQGETRVLVSTDAAERGLDLPEVSHIIHYDLPETPASFIHRSGRSAHQSDTRGTVIVLMNANDTRTQMGKTILKNYDRISPEEKTYDLSVPIPKEKKRSPDVTKILIRAGKKDKIRKKDIIGALCTRIPFEDIGVLDVQDTYTAAVILKPIDPDTLNPLSVKGKKRKVERVKNTHIQ